ncbi:MAG: TRAP transporter large permease [Desulfarculus sp.]|jgi:C4-dicarboxylate transporter DctM subunit|nr:MAG: TRAP transporter large permease [Desulfarculus sp.]
MSEAAWVLTVGFLTLLLLGMPLVFALGLSSLAALWLSDIDLVVIAQRVIAGTQSFPLLAVPGFILAGDLMTSGGLSTRLVQVAEPLVRHVRGGLGMVSVLASMFFACISGSAPATTATVGSIMIPEMIKRGYSKRFATSLAVCVGPIGQIIPPSIPFIVWGVIAETSITRLFLAGVIPGVLCGLGYMAVCYFMARKYNLPTMPKATAREFGRALNRGKWALFAPVLILGGIYGGIFTPTEASIVAIAYGLVVGLFIYKGLKLKDLGPLVLKSMKTTAIVMFIIAVASVFGWLLAYEQVPDKIVAGLMSISSNKLLILLMLNAVLLILGAFMDNLAAMIILGGLLIKLGLTLGIDPVQLGAIVVVNFAVGMETPPFGYSLFVGSAISGLRIEEISKSMLPFFIVDLGMLLLVTYAPWATLWLGKLILG